ncbi:MAG: phosphoribosylglycinamide formyltransferase [Oscillospiraceae bacterium]
MVRVAVLVSGGGTNLQAILDAKANGKMPSCEIALVVASKAKVFALERADKANVKSAVLARKEYASAADYDKALLKVLKDNDIQIVVLAGFLTILGESVIKAYPERIINVHPSLIPSFCGEGYYGLRVHEAALARGVKVTGATVHFVNEIPDGGRIILQKAVEIQDGDTAEILQKRVMENAEWLLLPKAIEMVAQGIIV